MQKIKLDCDACGAPLQDVDRLGLFKCPYCGRSYIFEKNLRTNGEGRKKQSSKVKADQLPEIPTDRQTSPASKELIAQIRALLEKRMKIQAIQLYRGETGAGLKEAKDFVESLEEKAR